jgi:hypothetical protein
MDETMTIETTINIAKPLPIKDSDFESLRNLLDQVCLQVAQHFTLYNRNGKPRKASVIEAIANSTCLACITKQLSAQTTAKDVDALYRECHTLAVSILVEELYNLLSGMGYKVMISTEAELEYGKADILITITPYGVNLKSKGSELMVEVKTGNSLSLSQLFRYLLDGRSNMIVVWRVKRRQVLTFDAENIRPILMEFMRMICLRGARLLSSPQLSCQHSPQMDYRPTQEELQKMFQDFAEALTLTLPHALEIIIEKLGVQNSEVKQ